MRAPSTRTRRAWALARTAVLVLGTALPARADWILNTAAVESDLGSTASNTDSLWARPAPTPSVVRFHQHAPGVPRATPTRIDAGACSDADGNFYPFPAPRTTSGQPIDTSEPVPLVETDVFHAGEAVFVTLEDANRNEDDEVRESIELTVTTSTGDEERLRLFETGLDTGVFATVIQSVGIPPPVVRFDCQLSVAVDTDLRVDYVDPDYPADTSYADALVDPYGFVFVSTSGEPVNDVSVTVLDAATNQPAIVFGDDATSRFPATVRTGATITDASGRLYEFPAGCFRFPYVAPGRYRLSVEAPPAYTVPSRVPIEKLQALRDPSGDAYVVRAGASFGQEFAVEPGPALRIDIPIDPLATELILQKAASVPDATIGDFLQYRLTIQNPTTGIANLVIVTDDLPAGLRYEPGSLRVGTNPVPDPTVSADGRTLTIAPGHLGPGETLNLTYVVHVTSGVRSGDAVNRAQANADGGLRSNPAEAVVHVRDGLFGDRAILVGRVVEGDCGSDRLRGVPRVRVMLEDGTFVATDDEGQYHFEGVRPGTHVVQVDVASLPADLVIAPCAKNSRFAGRAFSQFVDVQGGSLWRADFHVRRLVQNPLELRIEVEPHPAPPPVKSTRIDQYTLNLKFDTALATLRPDARGPLEDLVAELDGSDIELIRVIAHTDSVRIAPRYRHVFADNQDLSEARAKTVAAYLGTGLGLGPEQIRTAGRGRQEPVASNRTAAGRQLNRRAEVLVHRRTIEVESSREAPRFDVAVEAVVGSTAVRGLVVTFELPAGHRFVPGSARVDGPCPFDVTELWSQALTFRLPDPSLETVHRIELQMQADTLDTASCTTTMAQPRVRAMARFETGFSGFERAWVVPAVPMGSMVSSASDSTGAPADSAASSVARAVVLGDAAANGAGVDWFDGTRPGIEWLFPPAGHNPRLPSVRLVVQHEPGQRVELYLDGEPVSPLHLEAIQWSADSTRVVRIWGGVDIEDGANRFTAVVIARDEERVAEIERTVHFSGSPVRVELVPEESRLIADGIDPPVVAVRFHDREDRPVHAGVTGPFVLHPPYETAERIAFEKERALAGLDRFQPMYRVEGDEGLAYIELAPTTESGEAVLVFAFDASARPQELRVWLDAAPRDWVLVGFAAGTLGYNKLSGDMRSLDERDVDASTWADSELRLYAKGRVPGRCLLTLAVDLDDENARARTGSSDDRRASLKGVIDPDAFYTLYGDGTTQLSDAPSQERLYLKLERSQFFALFGDYDTGMTVTELTRYSRSLNGLKSVYSGDRVGYTAFASHTAQRSRRDEIAGNGTSGLYQLTRRDPVIGSEKIRLETRDRFKSEQIVESRHLVRHIDYDIDYTKGTLFFRQPIATRDFAFNPIFIVAEYETREVAERKWNAGGRGATRFFDGRLTTGASWVRETDDTGATDLGGLDARLAFGADTELRLEAARSEGGTDKEPVQGDAYLVELTHRGSRLETRLYSRAQDPGFGVGQQNGSETGTRKSGLEARFRLDEVLSADGQAFRQKNTSTGTTRDVTHAQVRYQTPAGGGSAGLQYAVDQTRGGRKLASEQITLGANRRFLDRRLDLQGRGEIGISAAENVDFPSRYTFQAGYLLTDDVRLTLAEEYATGASFDAMTTRLGAQVNPWRGARVNATLNQGFGEYGPRTFGVLGLTQALLLGERWGVDLAIDDQRTFRSPEVPPVFHADQPLASTSQNGDYTAVSTGATYRASHWTWNGRAELRAGDLDDRFGLTTGFLHQLRDGVAWSLGAQYFDTNLATGQKGNLADIDFSWAHRSPGGRWSILDRLRFEHESSSGGTSGSIRRRRVVQNLSLNRLAGNRAEDGNPLDLEPRAQLSLHYGSKYVLSRFEDLDTSGYTDLLGTEVRFDLNDRLDLGLHGSVLHSWHANNYKYSFGPSVGLSPFRNTWVTLGYNVRGFRDADFDAARYAFGGPYLKLRFKLDQATWTGGSQRDPFDPGSTR